MHLALVDLDNGLFLEGDGDWTADRKHAQVFPDAEAVETAAASNKVRNAAAVMMDGDPPRVRGFVWVTKPVEKH